MRADWDTEIDETEERSVRRIADLLAAQSVRVLESEGLLLRATSAEVAVAMQHYAGRLVPLPPHALDLADVAQFGASGEAFILDLPLWTSRGRSDLVVSFLVRRGGVEPRVGVWDVGMP